MARGLRNVFQLEDETQCVDPSILRQVYIDLPPLETVVKLLSAIDQKEESKPDLVGADESFDSDDYMLLVKGAPDVLMSRQVQPLDHMAQNREG